MKFSLFQPGDRVFYPAKGFVGTVQMAFHDGEDFRYYVRYRGILWSVPESDLDAESVKNAAQSDQGVTGAKILQFPGARSK